MTTPRNKFMKLEGSRTNRSRSETVRQSTAEFPLHSHNLPVMSPRVDSKDKILTKISHLENFSNAGEKKSLQSTPRNIDFALNKPHQQSSVLIHSIIRRDSSDSVFTLSRDRTPDATPRSVQKRQNTAALFSAFSKNFKSSNTQTPKRTSSVIPQPLNYTKQPRDNYFLKTKRPQPNATGTLSPKRLPSINLETKAGNPSNPALLGLSSVLFPSAAKKKPQYLLEAKKIIEITEEILIDKPVKSSISVKNLQIAEKLALISSNGDSSERQSLSMRSLYSFLELIQHLVHIMKESLNTCKLIQSSVEEIADVLRFFSKHPCKEPVVEICNWVYFSRCIELNLKELSEIYDIDASNFSTNDAEKIAFDEVQVDYLVNYLSTYVQDFEKLLHISKYKIMSEISIRERDLIPRTIRQADVICKCVSELLIEDFSTKKVYLANESRNLINGLLFSIKQIRCMYEKIREIIQESLELYKTMFRQVKSLNKNANEFVENQKKLKKSLERLRAPASELTILLKGMDSVEHNVKTFGVKYTDGIDTLKKVLSFKLKVENVETLFQMPVIEKKLSKHMDMLSQYAIRGNPPSKDQIAAIFTDMAEIPPIKSSFSLFVSYLEDLLKSKIYNELFHESFTQLKAIDESVSILYNMVDEQFEIFVNHYFGSLVQQALKQKRIIKNEYWKILTWNDFSQDNSLEGSIARMSESVDVIKDCLSKTRLLNGNRFRKMIEKNELLDENSNVWVEEVSFAENFIEYLTKITAEVLKPQIKFNIDYVRTKKIKASFDKVLLSYIKLRNSGHFKELCLRIGLYLRGKQQEDKQDFLLAFEDSLQNHYMEVFFKNFLSKLQEEFEKYFINLLTPIPSDKFEKLKCFIASCDDALGSLCDQYSIQALQELSSLLLRRKEDLGIIVILMDQILLINEKKSTSLSNEDEAKIRSGSQSAVFKFLLESINSYEALHGQVNLTTRANELDAQMQKLEEKVTYGEFQKTEIETRLANLEGLTRNSYEEMKKSDSKRRDSSSASKITEMAVRIAKLRRKMLKVATNKQLNQLRVFEEEVKKVIHDSIDNQKDCYDIKVTKDQLEKLRQKVEEIKKNREELEDNEVAQEILEDLESNLTMLQFLASTGDKIELAITGKLETLEEVKVCSEVLKRLKDEFIEKIEEVEFLDIGMRNCTDQQLNIIGIIERYLSSAYKGISKVDIQVFKNEQLYDQIRFELGECFEINFFTHPAFKERIYSPDLEAIKTEIGSIRSGLENLSSLLRLDNMSMDEMVISSYEQASRLHGWLGQNLLHLFEDLVVITRLYGFLAVISEQLRINISSGEHVNLSEVTEQVQQAQELHESIKDYEAELFETLREIDSSFILRGKIKFVELELSLVDLVTQALKIERHFSESQDLQKQFELIIEKKSIADLRKGLVTQILEIKRSFDQTFKVKERTGFSLADNLLLSDLALTFELFVADLESSLRRGDVHLLGLLEDEFYLRLNPRDLGAKSSVKESQILTKILSEVRSIMRRKSIFESNLGAKYLVDVEFSRIYKSVQGNLICAIDIRMNYQSVKSVAVSIGTAGSEVKKIQELNDFIIDDCSMNYKLTALAINT